MVRKTFLRLIPFLLTIALITGCSQAPTSSYTKYSYEFMGVFDTVMQIVGYSKTQDEFDEMCRQAEARFLDLSRLYDIYLDYEGINNIKTINDNAGKSPVAVEQEIIDLLLFSKEWYAKTNGTCNIALGAVLRIWHDYREEGLADPLKAELPPMDKLLEANKHTDISKVIVNKENRTVYLEDEKMLLDVGSVAKGFATEVVANELEELGYTSFIISSGGNIRAKGSPLDGLRPNWGIGIQNPDGNVLDPDDTPLDIVYLSDASVVTSGDYQRYYTVNGIKYHHLIDPGTLMPANQFRSVTVVTKDSGLADFMSTILFIAPYEEGQRIAKEFGIDAFWVMQDGTVAATDTLIPMLKNLGGAKNTLK